MICIITALSIELIGLAASLLRGGAQAETAATKLAHLFGGLSLRRFRGFALSGGFGEAIGAVRCLYLFLTRNRRKLVKSRGVSDGGS
jgi:hypothetical protein